MNTWSGFGWLSCAGRLCGSSHPHAGVHLVLCGRFGCLLAAYFGASITVQLLLFVFVSIAALVGLRPLAKRFIDPHIVPTNADRLLGGEAQVTETIDNERSAGAVYIDGKTWTARSEDGNIIPAGEQVEVVRMEGVKLFGPPPGRRRGRVRSVSFCPGEGISSSIGQRCRPGKEPPLW